MAVNVHDGEVGKILVYLIGFTAFVIVALTWVPHWISPDSANITVEHRQHGAHDPVTSRRSGSRPFRSVDAGASRQLQSKFVSGITTPRRFGDLALPARRMRV